LSPEDTDGEGQLVGLRDGSTVLVRPVRPDDRQLFVDAFEHFGPDSRASRFLAAKGALSDDELDFLTNVDHERHEAFGAIDVERDVGVGVARMVRGAGGDDSRAEAAVAVVDDWQGRGLGALLLERLVERARELGIDWFVAVLRTDNRPMMSLFHRVGKVQVKARDGGVVTVEVELPTDPAHGALAAALRSVAAGDAEPAERSAR
jgi:GNAT superfamily N-acetyltransferase